MILSSTCPCSCRFSDNELSKENAQISPGDLRAIEGGVRREYGGGGSGEIGYVFGCLSYEVVLVVVGAITLISITIPVFMEENREALRLAVVGVKIIWCMFVLIVVLKKQNVTYVCFFASCVTYLSRYSPSIKDFIGKV
ncbi:hypothetical protein Q1695_013951 [Nippostrongylus brasiliensis]|nr:hypothetical protein Q1695_013951 [Nippostrongylus brasiliensis]